MKKYKEVILCPQCYQHIAVAKYWAPGYPILKKHKDNNKKPCYDGYLRPSKVHDGYTIS